MASRLKVGVDVPWVTSWTSEALLGVGPCATVDGRLAIGQAERPGEGKPQYSRNHLRRQRDSVRRMLCPMCGEPTAPGDRWHQTGKLMAVGALRARGLGPVTPADLPDAQIVLNAGAISPSHKACAERALEHCPHLGADPDPTIRPFPARWAVFPLTVEAQAPGGALLAAPRPPIPVISFLQLVGVTDGMQRDWRQRLKAETGPSRSSAGRVRTG